MSLKFLANKFPAGSFWWWALRSAVWRQHRLKQWKIRLRKRATRLFVCSIKGHSWSKFADWGWAGKVCYPCGAKRVDATSTVTKDGVVVSQPVYCMYKKSSWYRTKCWVCRFRVRQYKHYVLDPEVSGRLYHQACWERRSRSRS